MNNYPRGKLTSDDEGELTLKVFVKETGPDKKKTVIMDFGKPVKWMGMSGDEAVELANILMKRGREAGLTKPITIQV